MEAISMNVINVGPILDDLLTIIKRDVISEHLCLSLSAKGLGRNALGIMEDTLPEILQLLGIRSMIIDGSFDLAPLRALRIDIPEAGDEYLWPYLRREDVIYELQAVFRNCRTVGFDNWSAVSSASSVWDGLLSDVIKPLERHDLEFIFYLGDPMARLSFQVGEAIDIVSDFSQHGQVTFVLDESEAVNLWKMLNGVGRDTDLGAQNAMDLRKKYFSIFRTMNIARVFIYSTDMAMVFTEAQQFAIVRKRVDHEVEIAPDARLKYIGGLSTGLALGLDMPHCVALGLVAFGHRAENGELKGYPEKQDLVRYTEDWIADLQRESSISLYAE